MLVAAAIQNIDHGLHKQIKIKRAKRTGILTQSIKINPSISARAPQRAGMLKRFQRPVIQHVIAAKAVAFAEALQPDFKVYAQNVVDNARALAAKLAERGCDIVSGGTDTHLMLVDLRPKGLTGKAAEASMEAAGITCNKNGIPFDPEKPMITSGVRLGSPAGTTRGFGIAEFEQIGELVSDVLDGLAANPEDNSAIEDNVRKQVEELCARFPIYSNF